MNQIIDVTEKAISHISSMLESERKNESDVLRVSVIGGGCSGFSYKIEFAPLKEKDNVLDFQNFKIAIDPKSSIYLKGVQLDFQDGLNGKGFVFQNPNAKNTCGCGESFSM